ncbi:BREX-1 system adenine-specific DNA-methyltransferase PglX [Vagococcus fluvialis]|uniref:BREX-1 system adenine-specific DNA-methyltransferase PglX n=2 Tax=Vagococcus fluvialis TaxID=2738 RepID=UPI003B5AFA98
MDFDLQELKLLDNAMGSGHVLVYAFDVFLQLYVAEGFRERDAAELIMKNNLFGLEIDKRAYQLAYFAIMMKGRQYSRRIFSKNISLNLYQFINSEDISEEFLFRLREVSSLTDDEFSEWLEKFNSVMNQFKHATEIGSILNIKDLSLNDIKEVREQLLLLKEYTNMDILYSIPETHERTLNILNIAETLLTKYTSIVTNPPYLNKMSSLLDKYVKSNYPEVKTDLFSVFIKMNNKMLVENGYTGFMTPFVWMFIKSYEHLRGFLIHQMSISSLILMEYSAFEEATVPVCCFTIKNSKIEPVGTYLKLSEFRGGMEVQQEKVLHAIQNNEVEYFYQTKQNNFKKIPGHPISFWVSEKVINNFIVGKRMEFYGDIKSGIMVNSRFILNWNEVNRENINFNCTSIDDMNGFKWFPLNSGGGNRKWFGNNIPVINLEDNGKKIIESRTNHRLRNTDFYFKQGITWGRITSADISFRKSHQGNLFGDAGPMLFTKEYINQILALTNSKIMLYFSEIINPTLNFQVDDMKNIPVILDDKKTIEKISTFSIDIAKKDWDLFEISWGFKKHPLI